MNLLSNKQEVRRVIVPAGCMLSDTFTHATVSLVTGVRVFVGQLSACEELLRHNHRLAVIRLRVPVILLH
jgi:hypothetical protein